MLGGKCFLFYKNAVCALFLSRISPLTAQLSVLTAKTQSIRQNRALSLSTLANVAKIARRSSVQVVGKQEQSHIACFKRGWRLPGQDGRYKEETDTAVCLQKCDEKSCSSVIPLKYRTTFTPATVNTPTIERNCANATCQEGLVLYGGFENATEPVKITAGAALHCTGGGQWKDAEGRRFAFPACKASIACAEIPALTQAKIDEEHEQYTLQGYPLESSYQGFPALECPPEQALAYFEILANMMMMNWDRNTQSPKRVILACKGDKWRILIPTESSDKPFYGTFVGCVLPSE